jgi:3-isopropylmalate/(R)-2-methylmalate dehydratase small subunit
VIAESFGDIFYNNCFQNGMLPVVLPAVTVARPIAAFCSVFPSRRSAPGNVEAT